MSTFLDLLTFALSTTLPIFIVIVLGSYLKSIHFLNDEFNSTASKLVFNIGMPITLFFSSAQTDFNTVLNSTLILVGALATLLIVAVAWFVGKLWIAPSKDVGVFIQGAYRGNLVIVGLAFCYNAYGEQGLAVAALPTAILVILYNVIAVYVLNMSLSNKSTSLLETGKDIIKNPLLIGIFFGILLNSALTFTNAQIPKPLLQAGKYFSQLSLPLALLCIGGSARINRRSLWDRSTVLASLVKLLVAPAIAVFLALSFELQGIEMGILFLLTATPTATASFIMVEALNGNSVLAANIVIITAFGSLLSVTLGLSLLKYFELL